MIKILNLYAGIGGNRKLWTENIEVTAVEIIPEIAKLYKTYFPTDTVIITDAHKFLLNNYKNYDFIWSSCPCTSHSRARYWGYKNKKPIYPDLKLYQEIIFLQYHSLSKWVVENVISYYDPFIKPIQLGRRYFWSNFKIINKKFDSKDIRQLSGTSFKDKLIRNMVNPEIGLHIFNCALKEKQMVLI